MHLPTVTVTDLPDPLPDDLAVLDVREHVEWHHGHIEGAVHVPLTELPARVSEVPEGRVVVVCKVGGRSARATAWLAQQGRDAANLDGGLVEWADAGRPLVSDSDGPAQVV